MAFEQGILIRKRTIFFLLTTLLYLAIVMGARIFFSATAGSDTNTVAELAESGRFGLGGAYAATAMVYAYTPESLRQVVVLGTGIWFIWFCTSRAATLHEAAVMSFLCLAPCLMAIGTFQKDMLLVWFIIPVAVACQNAKDIRFAVLAYVAIYAAYALIFRQYFAIILVIGLLAYVFARSGPIMRIAIAGGVLCALLLTPVEILYLLQAPRDAANFERIYVDGRMGARTAFMNPYQVTGLWPFVMNYLYAFWAIDLSVLKNLTIKEIYLLINIVFYYLLMIWGFRSGQRRNVLLSSIIFGHVAVLHLFEPDSGSYLRHLSSTLPYAAVLMFNRRAMMLHRPQADHHGLGQPA